METEPRIVLSASRRTDIPAFYMSGFMEGIARGEFAVENPFNRKAFTVPAGPDRVHSIVFWSKNFGPFLKGGYARKLFRKGYGLFFHFTVNSEDPVLEPKIPPLADRLAQMAALAGIAPPGAVAWRFDPVCHYEEGGRVRDNLGDFEKIANAAADCGITRCVTSFMDPYAKVLRRAEKRPGFSFVSPDPDAKAEILAQMAQTLQARGIRLFTCCEKEVLDRLPPGLGAGQGACVDHDLLESLYGPGLSHLRDRGQRVKKGCGCQASRDVGSYRTQACGHGCLYCYANPAP